MPLNTLRLNQRKLHPNDRIVFIKALPGPDADTAADFLSRVAAICLPIMKAHHLSVTTLEEHEPNPEFLGQNFNAGECIQLVLKSRSGNWLPFRFVQMVMMHELAHCNQMNHSRAFWALKNTYSVDLKALWTKGYTGEGMWGRGRSLYDGQFAGDGTMDPTNLPEHLCGGTFRSRRKRKAKGKSSETNAEKKQRRIEKKFGKGGTALGEDELTRAALEGGRWNVTKPRVAQSKRGRELRAAALLDRIEKDKKDKVKEEEQREEDDGSETEWEDDDAPGEIAVDRNGKRLRDDKGFSLVKVCGDEDVQTEDAMRELTELANFGDDEKDHEATDSTQAQQFVKLEANHDDQPLKPSRLNEDDISTASEDSNSNQERHIARASPADSMARPKKNHDEQPATSPAKPMTEKRSATQTARPAHPPPAISVPSSKPSNPPMGQVCGVCSFANDVEALTCMVCANVLDVERLPRHWRCKSDACRGSTYVNAEDAGVCGVCGAAKP